MEPHERDLITLRLAPDGRYARVARTVVASCASLEGFVADDLGDIRLLVDTAFHTLTDVGRGDVDINVESSVHELAIEMSARRDGDRGWSDPEVRLLDTVASVVGRTRTFAVRDERLIVRVVVRPRSDGEIDVR